MNITIDELIKGKPTSIKSKNYFSTQRYVQPFLEKMGVFTNDFTVMAKTPDQMTINDGLDVTFNKVLIQAKLENKINDLNENIFMAYELDVRKPVVKLYKGYTDEDNNFFVFNPMALSLQEILPEEAFVYNVKSLMEMTDNTADVITNIKETIVDLSDDNLSLLLGEWVRKSMDLEYKTDFGKIKLASSLAINAYKSLFLNRESKHYIPTGQSECTMYDIYCAFASLIREDSKDIINKFEKTLLLNLLLGL